MFSRGHGLPIQEEVPGSEHGDFAQTFNSTSLLPQIYDPHSRSLKTLVVARDIALVFREYRYFRMEFSFTGIRKTILLENMKVNPKGE